MTCFSCFYTYLVKYFHLNKKFIWRGIGQKGHFCICPKSNHFMSFTSRTKIFEIRSLHNVGNGLYRVFTIAKRALSFQQQRAIIQEILFSFFKCKGTLSQKKGTFLLLEKVGWGGAHYSPVSAAPVIGSEFFIKTRIRIRQFWIGMDFNNSQLSDYKRPIRCICTSNTCILVLVHVVVFEMNLNLVPRVLPQLGGVRR